ncbi:MAG TPA: hypothetical protein PLD48_09135 [Bacillota bacterium]|jgi:hypothetical protein|nr:hypothetical protein [Bacillota bacterium]HOK69684.1 hypothetical protein [Bacillota bacterium]
MDNAKNEKLFENVYRTRDYIVKQELYLIVNAEQNNAVLSVDTYYRRTLLRDSKYQLLYKDRKHIDGKRLPSNTYIRTYID